MPDVRLDYIAAGGNRHPSAADWTPGLLAFGAGNNVALWNPDDDRQRGIFALLAGHTGTVNAVKILHFKSERCIITGGADKAIRIWRTSPLDNLFAQTQCLTEHQGSVNVIAVIDHLDLFVSGSADGTLKVWDFSNSTVKLVQSISLQPRFFPLTCALAQLQDGAVLLAVAGTTNAIQLLCRAHAQAPFEHQATLSGHEGWIRSLDFVSEGAGNQTDLLLASASQDKYIRLWRFHCAPQGSPSTTNSVTGTAMAITKKSLSNRMRQIGSASVKYNVTFEALLIGHEDWIYTARWAPQTSGLNTATLLSASADNSIAIWRADESSGVWVCDTRLGEISALKGSTTATGSTGGFWIGLWRPDGQAIVSLGRTGSWRSWAYESTSDMWRQYIGISGHTQEVQGLTWAPDGSYLLSTGSDQTTRLFAKWKRDEKQSWHEFARPQIHGYDLNCIGSLTPDRFISGADEKLLRVFNKPKAVDSLLAKLCGIKLSSDGALADAADIPVLGLSNKAIATSVDEHATNDTSVTNGDDQGNIGMKSSVHKTALELDQPPFEELLARHTLWPEHEKLYGHGYEISALATSHDGSVIATACKASSIDHAVIRIYECEEWREVKPPLPAHSLTVTSLAFSPDDRYLLSVGRDRRWAVFERDNATKNCRLLCSNPKGHSRMMLDCSWAPSADEEVFATAGRDKVVKVWRLIKGNADCIATIPASAAVTAVDFDRSTSSDNLRLAYGTEEGVVRIVELSKTTTQVVTGFDIDATLIPSRAVNALCWRPSRSTEEMSEDQSAPSLTQLATASDDYSIRIFDIGT